MKNKFFTYNKYFNLFKEIDIKNRPQYGQNDTPEEIEEYFKKYDEWEEHFLSLETLEIKDEHKEIFQKYFRYEENVDFKREDGFAIPILKKKKKSIIEWVNTNISYN